MYNDNNEWLTFYFFFYDKSEIPMGNLYNPYASLAFLRYNNITPVCDVHCAPILHLQVKIIELMKII